MKPTAIRAAAALAASLAAAPLAAACRHAAPAETTTTAGAPAAARRASAPRPKREVISLEEIRSASEAQNAYEVVRRLRPTFLADRGPQSFRKSVPSTALVYVDDVRMGGLEALRDIPRDGIAEIRFYSGPDATTRWGTGHSSGVIYVTMRH